MHPSRKPLIAGNWKMNGLHRDSQERVRALIALNQAQGPAACQLLVCPPFTSLTQVAEALAGSGIDMGAQDCHAQSSGAHTGDISPQMLVDSGCSHVILGHSERRTDHGETDAQVAAKALAAQGAGLVAIICIGETESERDAGQTLDVIGRQIAGSIPEGATAANTVIAYEPVWAIGTGRTPTVEQVDEVHRFIRGALAGKVAEAAKVRILYGGSMKPSNARELLAVEDVDGGLIGGASLKAEDFWAIAESCR